jgi:hypothetical protein
VLRRTGARGHDDDRSRDDHLDDAGEHHAGQRNGYYDNEAAAQLAGNHGATSYDGSARLDDAGNALRVRWACHRAADH